MRSTANAHDSLGLVLRPVLAGPWYQGRWGRTLSALALLTAIGRRYQRAASGNRARPFAQRALDELRIAIEVDAEDVARIPPTGAMVVVANHPFGAVDGLALLALTSRVRSDVKVLANHLLAVLPGIGPRVIGVDVFRSAGSRRRNAAAVREAAAWLEAGHCLCVFPAGEVAHVESHGRVVDSPWRRTAAELALKAGAAVVPIRFEGHNSRLFRWAGRVHPLLRTALLPWEMWARRGRSVTVHVGDALPAPALREYASAAARIAWLRSRVDALPLRRPAAVAVRGEAAAIAADVAALGNSALIESGPYAVYCAGASRLPAVLPEIGRLRELTFRAVGEGTGKARDLDEFDPSYLHLFVWDRRQSEIAGAYRICATDRLGPDGARGLYTSTLFRFDDVLLQRLGPALELGRSFVAPSYQREFSPLLLLWKGIGRFVASAPRYRHLFGAVSISDRYSATTRNLLASFLSASCGDAQLAGLVQPRHPLPPRPVAASTPASATFDDLSSAVRALEADGKDMPVLLRQYLKLNARLLGFSVDPTFGDALDGLLLVDLTRVEGPLLDRYLGRHGARVFLETHGAARAISSPPRS
jgi:putative hemolysin